MIALFFTKVSYLTNLCSTGVETMIILVGCRGGDDVTGQTFTLNNCSAGYVIRIQSAFVFYDSQWNLNVNPPTCTFISRLCLQQITHHEVIRRCNGLRTCNISQTILNYPQDNVTRLCDAHEDGNVIYVLYSCITGTWKQIH